MLSSALVLPVSLVGLGLGAHALTVRLLGRGQGVLERWMVTVLLTIAMPIAIVVALGTTSALGARATMTATALVAVAAGVFAGRRARSAVILDAVALVSILRRALLGGAWSVAALVGLSALALATAAAWLLPVWAWDALGYHLPFVYDALLSGRLRTVPTHIPYVNAYPHAADLYFLWWRAMLPDDTWIDLAQLPFGILAVLATAVLATRASVDEGRALGLALTFLAVPVVMLQLATNYVDVAYAALLVASAPLLFGRTLQPARVAVAGLALGLFLGTKPSAPLPFVILALSAAVAHRARITRVVILIALALAVGAPAYVMNVMEHGNPVWPVQLSIGPIHLPGREHARYFFDLGVPDPYRSYGWARRLLASLYAWPTRFSYDMRIGGLGPAIGFVLLPVAVFAVMRPRGGRRRFPRVFAVLAIASIATPAAFWARYTLALPAVLLAVVAVATHGMSRRARVAIELQLALAAVVGVGLALPGLTDMRVPLTHVALVSSAQERARVFGGIDGDEASWLAARERVASGESIAYDDSLGLPGRVATGRQTKILYVGGTPDDELSSTLREERVRVAVLADERAARIMRSGVALERLFACRYDPCTVYWVP